MSINDNISNTLSMVLDISSMQSIRIMEDRVLKLLGCTKIYIITMVSLGQEILISSEQITITKRRGKGKLRILNNIIGAKYPGKHLLLAKLFDRFKNKFYE
jgi:hypothetical protein